MNLNEIVGIDNGFGELKAKRADGFEINMPSFVDRIAGKESLGKDHVNFNYQDQKGKYLVGDDAVLYGHPTFRSPDSSYFRTDEYRVLFLHALEKLGCKNARVATGLPIEFYKQDVEELQDTIRSFSNNRVKINTVKVLLQPVGSIVDVAMDWQGGRRINLQDAQVPIIDIGHGTIDAMEIINMKPTKGMFAGRTAGVSTIHTAIYNHIRHKYDVGNNITIADMGKYLRRGSFKFNGKEHSLEKVIKQAKLQLAQTVNSLIEEVWGNIKTMEYVLITGGGAEVIRDEISKMIPEGQLLIPENPSMANANGFCKWMYLNSK